MTSDLRARVRVDGTTYYLGKFKTPSEARAVELEFKKKHNLSLNRSDAARKAWRNRRIVGL